MSLTHFTEKAWLITWESSGGGNLYSRQYGTYGIYNKKSLAKLAFDELLQKESINSRINYELQEVGLNECKELFAFHY
jgi:hypothetical protein